MTARHSGNCMWSFDHSRHGRSHSPVIGTLLLTLVALMPSLAHGGSPVDVLVGVGTTWGFQYWTDGLVIPITLELDESRWELGAFRMATSQYVKDVPLYPPSTLGAQPYWGFTAMHRWQILHRSRVRYYVGFGANYKTETDLLDATRWNFAYLIAARFDIGQGAMLELSARHWSNAWIKEPNRGQNFLSISFGF